ncbi:MAG: sigma-54-dependent Fis family transcriptional regulator [Planctomycetes bacterium]|nr:sigma-54-dependent Fis family transcriptional regulator [Planctomycetota bacterium]
MATVLVVDDEQSIIWAFERFLSSLGHKVLCAPTAEQALDMAREAAPDLVILDVKLPGMDGLAALEELRKRCPAVQGIIITAHGTLDTAVRAMKLGAVEYLAKPIDLEKARRVIEAALSKAPVSREVERLRAERGPEFGNIVGKTPAMQEVFKKVAAVCDSEASVLIVGESGTGKELLARALHTNSGRANAPFEPINCASIPEALLESELFGHEKGAFTGAVRQKRGKFEIADGGTIFLDEIGEISPATQVKLLRFLEERTFSRVGGTDKVAVDVRIVSATNSNVEQRLASGSFREDLYFRLNVVKIEVPPLRERREDVPRLVAHFMDHWGVEAISQEALEILKRHSWPGNVRELRNAMERGAVLSRKKTIRPEHLPESILHPQPMRGENADLQVTEWVEQLVDDPSAPRRDLLRHVESKWEKALIRKTLLVTGGNQVKASEWLGINRITLRKKMQEYGL